MALVHLKDGDDTLATLDLEVIPRAGELLSFSAIPSSEFWSAETERNHRRLEQGVWRVKEVCHFVSRRTMSQASPTYQFVALFLGREDASIG